MFSEKIMGRLPYRLIKAYIERKTNTSAGIALYPTTLSVDDMLSNIDKCISFIPYCAKPVQCPEGRKTQECRKLRRQKCGLECSVGEMITELHFIGMKSEQIFIIDCDDNLFTWLKCRREEGYEYFLPGIGCHYGVAYALNYIHKKMGYSGVVMFLEGDTCRCKVDYDGMEGMDKGKKTRVCVNRFVEMLE